jgi:ADP-ribose pyrophosphatase YjhB (NUDIX family)
LTSLPLARRWRKQVYPMASVLAIIRRDSESVEDGPVSTYLLIQRLKEPYAGKWGLVGGRWEFGETLETAITREVKEETGLDTTFVALRGVVSERIAPGNAGVDGAHYVLFVCELSAPTGIAREQSEGPVAWFTPHDIVELQDRLAIIVTDHAILQRFGQTGASMTYLEVDVVAGDGADKVDQLVRFAAGP